MLRPKPTGTPAYTFGKEMIGSETEIEWEFERTTRGGGRDNTNGGIRCFSL